MAGTLYTYPDNFRAYKVLIAAQYSGAPIKVISEPPEFVLGQTNKTSQFLEKFPLGKVPAFVTDSGSTIYESNAIAYYVANGQLRGTSDIDTAHILQYINMADNEILPSACTWTFPTLGIMQYNKGNTEQAQSQLKTILTILNSVLATRTFLVGERVTLADITCVCNLLLPYKQVFEPKWRAPYPNVNRWFLTCINQPQFKAVLGEVTLSTKMASFDAKAYNELFPKKQKEKKEKAPATPKKKEEPKEAPPPAPAVEEEEEEKPKEKPKDPYAEMPPTTFNLDAFKRSYSNEDTLTKAIPHFWENFDREGWSIWKCVYKYPEELKMIFMCSNLVSGMLQRIDKLRKNAFASILILGENNNAAIEGVWVMRGHTLFFELNEDWGIDAPSYDWTKLDPDNEEDKGTINKYFSWEGDFGGREVADGKIFK